MNAAEIRKAMLRTAALLVLGILYLILVSMTFIFKIDLANDRTMQYILHITVILTAFAYLFFADIIYSTEIDKANGRAALILAALFVIPILIGRSIGIVFMSFNTLGPIDSIYNFYAEISISRTIEMISWAMLLPLSMVFLALLFFKKDDKTKLLAWFCLLTAVCCFAAFGSFFSMNSIYLFIGLLGWGLLFLMVVISYMIWLGIKKKEI
jgi:hypothetical protein